MIQKKDEPVHETQYPAARGVLTALTLIAGICCILMIGMGATTENVPLLIYGIVGLIGLFFQYMLFAVLFDISDHTRQTRDAVERLNKELKARPVTGSQPETPKANLGPTRYNPKTHEYEAI